jgi:hypothetical protein
VAIAVLAYGIYFRRYCRSDLLLAYVALNVGVFTVTAILANLGEAGLGLGLGLFGILSIIRLRSDTITQEEVAYYFVALAVGLVNGLQPPVWWVGPLLSGTLLAIMYVVDSPRVTRRTQRLTVTLDAAYADPVVLRDALIRLLNTEIRHLSVLELDLVRDVTVVEVRCRSARSRTVIAVPMRRPSAGFGKPYEDRGAGWARGQARVPS